MELSAILLRVAGRCGKPHTVVGVVLPVRARLLLVFGLLFSAGCTVFFRQPELVFGGFRPGDWSEGATAVEVSIQVHNPNRYRLGLQHLTYAVSVGGVVAATGATESALEVPGRSSGTLSLPITLDWDARRGKAWEAVTSGGFDYTVEGEGTFSTPVGTFRRRYRKAGHVSLFGNGQR
jgi:LEA14-like dessication related protein